MPTRFHPTQKPLTFHEFDCSCSNCELKNRIELRNNSTDQDFIAFKDISPNAPHTRGEIVRAKGKKWKLVERDEAYEGGGWWAILENAGQKCSQCGRIPQGKFETLETCEKCKKPFCKNCHSSKAAFQCEGCDANVSNAGDWYCQECGYNFKSSASAEKAAFSDSGCPKCGGSDVDMEDPKKQRKNADKTATCSSCGKKFEWVRDDKPSPEVECPTCWGSHKTDRKNAGERIDQRCTCGHTRSTHDPRCYQSGCECMGFELKNSSSWAVTKKCSFIEAGIVNYADVGMVLVRKEALDKMANSFIGKPVVNEQHKAVSPDGYKEGTHDGIVNAVWFEPTDGMFHCSYQVWDKPTLSNINKGFKVSCAYAVTRWGPGGIHNNVPYEKEVLDGEYTHLAVVDNPRYESVRIYNNKGAKTMTLQWIKKIIGADKKVIENSVEIDSARSVVDIGGKEIPMDELINAFQASEKKKAEVARKALENQAPADTDMIDIGGGKKVSVADLKNAYKAKNDEDEDEKKKKKAEEDEKENPLKNAEEKKKMDDEHEKGDHDKDEKENCRMCNAIKNARGAGHFQRVKELANSRPSIDDLVNELPEPVDGFEEGRKRFGSEKAAATK